MLWGAAPPSCTSCPQCLCDAVGCWEVGLELVSRLCGGGSNDGAGSAQQPNAPKPDTTSESDEMTHGDLVQANRDRIAGRITREQPGVSPANKWKPSRTGTAVSSASCDTAHEREAYTGRECNELP